MEKKIKYSLYESIAKKLKLKIISQKEEEEDFQKSNNEILEYKILIIGDHFTGKTSFCLRFALNKFNLEIESSKQSECYLKTLLLLGKEIKVYLIDVINSNNFFNEELLKDIKGVIAIYDITKFSTFESAETIIKKILKKLGKKLGILFQFF